MDDMNKYITGLIKIHRSIRAAEKVHQELIRKTDFDPTDRSEFRTLLKVSSDIFWQSICSISVSNHIDTDDLERELDGWVAP